MPADFKPPTLTLIVPVEQTPEERAIEACLEIVERGVADVRAIKAGGMAQRPSFNGTEYDEAYAQGCKDTARTLLITLGVEGLGVTSDDQPKKED